MSQYVGNEKLSRVAVRGDGFEYDASTGFLTLPDNKPEIFEYTYKSLDKEMANDVQYMRVNAHITYRENSVMIFEDVQKGEWFYNYVEYVYHNQLMTGINSTIFGSRQPLARAQFAVILHRIENEPKVEYIDSFPDVMDGAWYTDAIMWASQIGIVNGYTDTGLFGTGDKINREQMAVMMYRYAKYKGFGVSKKAELDGFADAFSINKFAKEAMEWAVGSGIITGKENGTKIDLQGNALRVECAAIIMRFVGKYEK